MFFKDYDELMARLNSSFVKKKTIQELALKFEDLAKKLDIDNPFEQGMIALAMFGQMQCYEKLCDKVNLIRISMTAARLFIKSAKFNFEISRTMRDLWSDPLADGIQCYKIAYKSLKSGDKPNLAVAVLNELAQVETQFEFHHYAGNTYEEAVMFCIKKNLRPRVMIEATLECVKCYYKCGRYDLSLMILDKVLEKLEQSYLPIIAASPLMRQEYEYLRIIKSQMYYIMGRFQDCIEYSTPNLNPKIVDILAKFCSMDQTNNYENSKDILKEIRNIKDLTQFNVEVFESHISERVNAQK